MNPRIQRLFPAAVLAGVLVSASAQQAAVPAQIDWAKAVPEASFKAPRINNESSWRLKTPRIAGNSTHKEREWGVFDYSFDTLAEWTDNVVVNYYILLDAEKVKDPTRPADAPRWSFLQLSLRFSDIPKGKDHKVSAVLLPAALLRFGYITAFGFEMTVQDKLVYADQQFANGSILIPTMKTALANNPNTKVKWWELTQVINNPKTAKLDGFLVDRAKTPFSLVSPDDYEMSK